MPIAPPIIMKSQISKTGTTINNNNNKHETGSVRECEKWMEGRERDEEGGREDREGGERGG